MTGIFGGSFNPIHNGHIQLARLLLVKAGLDEVWFMLSPQNPLKEQDALMDDSTRLRLAQAALSDEKGIKVCDHELRMPRPSYTYLTMRSLAAAYPHRHFTLIIGADNWHNFSRWRNGDELLSRYSMAVYPRTGYPVDTATLPPDVSYYDLPLIDISSTDIRRRISQGLPFTHLLPQPVAEIIIREGLYGVTS